MYCHRCGIYLIYENRTCRCGYNPNTTLLNVILAQQNPQRCECLTENPNHANFCQTCGKQLRKYAKCPKCSSYNFTFTRENSLKRAIKGGLIGGFILGPIGALALGYFNGHNKKITYYCNNCTNTWIEG